MRGLMDVAGARGHVARAGIAVAICALAASIAAGPSLGATGRSKIPPPLTGVIETTATTRNAANTGPYALPIEVIRVPLGQRARVIPAGPVSPSLDVLVEKYRGTAAIALSSENAAPFETHPGCGSRVTYAAPPLSEAAEVTLFWDPTPGNRHVLNKLLVEIPFYTANFSPGIAVQRTVRFEGTCVPRPFESPTIFTPFSDTFDYQTVLQHDFLLEPVPSASRLLVPQRDIPNRSVLGQTNSSFIGPGRVGRYALDIRRGAPTPTCFGASATITGTAGRDRLRGTTGRDVIVGLGGNDVIVGLGGNDLLCGGPGNDRVSGGQGADRLAGEAGRDALSGGPGADLLTDAAAGVVAGGPGVDRCRAPRARRTSCERLR